MGRSLFDGLAKLTGTVPRSNLATSPAPRAAAEAIAKDAARKAAAVSGGATLIPGLGSTVTLVPDLLATFAIQRRLVADIAALYGRTPELGPELMTALLFGEVAPGAVAPLKRAQGGPSGFRRVSDQLVRRALQKIAWALARRIAGRAVERLVPIVGAVGAGIGSYRGTLGVAKAAMEHFESPRSPLASVPGGPLPGTNGRVIQGSVVPSAGP